MGIVTAALRELFEELLQVSQHPDSHHPAGLDDGVVGSRALDGLLASEGHCILAVYSERTHISLDNVIVDAVLSIFPVFHETTPL